MGGSVWDWETMRTTVKEYWTVFERLETVTSGFKFRTVRNFPFNVSLLTVRKWATNLKLITTWLTSLSTGFWSQLITAWSDRPSKFLLYLTLWDYQSPWPNPHHMARLILCALRELRLQHGIVSSHSRCSLGSIWSAMPSNFFFFFLGGGLLLFNMATSRVNLAMKSLGL